MAAVNRHVLLVTGGSRGIGAAIASAAAAAGYAVAVNYRQNAAAADSLVKDIEARGGIAGAFAADVSDPRQVKVLFETLDSKFGRLDGLVNNAGTAGSRTAITESLPEDLMAVFSTNLFSAFACIRQAALRMGRSSGGRGGAIVNISSQAAVFGGGDGLAAYAASKAGVNALTLSAARELAPQGIRVNAVSPGIIDAGDNHLADDDRRSRMEAGIPLGRFGSPAEVAAAVLWLLSDAAAYVTGAILPVAGGR